MKKVKLPSLEQALPGREQPMPVSGTHVVLQTSMKSPFPEGFDIVYLGLGCFWGAERLFWKLDGVYTTAVGYQGGYTANPAYEEVCSGGTGHAEVVMVVFDPEVISLKKILSVFWESHDPTQGMKQGNDTGTQYRSAVYTTNQGQLNQALESMQTFQVQLLDHGYGSVTSEIRSAPPFYYAEERHQQYLAKQPDGYCGLKGTGVVCSI